MPKSLVIVESPAKAKTIQKYLGKDFEVVASKGHIKDLPKRGGVDMERGFQETYELIAEKGKSEVVKLIRDKAKKVDRVLLATDPDREGEAIAWHLMEEVKNAKPDAVIERVLFNEITKRGVKEGIEHPRQLDQHLYEAQRTRRVLDRIGGYPLSSLLWKKLTFGLSAGRVQTPALRLIVDRQREIDSFVPVDYWLVEVGLNGVQKRSFIASLDSVDGEKLDKVSSRRAVTAEPDATRFASDLKKASYRVAKLTKREQKRHAPAPYTTSKLQQDASTRIGMSPKSTMRVAQGLYEGVELGKGGETVGLITYMRTDSVRLSPDAVQECRDYIGGTYGPSSLPAQPNIFKTKKQNVQDAHEAIRPTRMDLPPDRVRNFLKDDQFKVYKLIWDRFVACQMVPAIYDQTTVEIEATGAFKHAYGLRASGSVLRVPGWKQVYGVSAVPMAGEEEEEDSSETDERLLPELSEGETLSIVEPPGVQVHHKQTEPPPYFNEASLVKKLEEEGIGRPSTYAEIISKVEARDYVQKINGKLVPSELGKLVILKLVEDHFDLADIGFTRKLEEDLDAVADARAKRLDVLAPFHSRLQQQIEKALEAKGKWWPEPEELEERCPETGHALVKRWGRNGPFIGCSAYPECKYTRHIPGPSDNSAEDASRQPELTDYKCDKCGAQMLKRWGRNGWFLGCSNYPKCKSTRNLPLDVPCPKCGGDIIEIRPKGRKRAFYGCVNYASEAKCDFRVWQRPVAETCPDCKAPFLVRAETKAGPLLKCLTEGCGYQRNESAQSETETSPLQPTGTDAAR